MSFNTLCYGYASPSLRLLATLRAPPPPPHTHTYTRSCHLAIIVNKPRVVGVHDSGVRSYRKSSMAALARRSVNFARILLNSTRRCKNSRLSTGQIRRNNIQRYVLSGFERLLCVCVKYRTHVLTTSGGFAICRLVAFCYDRDTGNGEFSPKICIVSCATVVRSR